MEYNKHLVKKMFNLFHTYRPEKLEDDDFIERKQFLYTFQHRSGIDNLFNYLEKINLSRDNFETIYQDYKVHSDFDRIDSIIIVFRTKMIGSNYLNKYKRCLRVKKMFDIDLI